MPLPVIMVVVGAGFVAIVVTSWRFGSAYHRRYEGVAGRAAFAKWFFRVPWRAPYRPFDLDRPLDDPEVDRLRKQARLAILIWFWVIIGGVVLFFGVLLLGLVFGAFEPN